jgi:5'-phosphate synthase pdxT subunit
MVKKISIGVIGIQGAVSEHISSMEKALKETNTPGEVIVIKNKQEINEIDALILPGGESTTISRILYKSGLYDAISKRIKERNLPIMGTCAGCVILASEMIDDTKDVRLLYAMDINVKRNAFGRQRESFEKNIEIKGFSESYNAVFIRAPVIEKVYGNCEILAKIDKKIVMARQGNLLALSYHPELTHDLRIHKYFLNMF